MASDGCILQLACLLMTFKFSHTFNTMLINSYNWHMSYALYCIFVYWTECCHSI